MLFLVFLKAAKASSESEPSASVFFMIVLTRPTPLSAAPKILGCAQVQLDVVAVAELLELPRGEVIPVVASDHFSDAKDAEPVLELVNHIPCHCLPHLLEHG